jgi:hypothetical protein
MAFTFTVTKVRGRAPPGSRLLNPARRPTRLSDPSACPIHSPLLTPTKPNPTQPHPTIPRHPQWRTEFRRAMNRAEAEANSRALDSLLNYETVKYFGNEAHELARHDECMAKYQVRGVGGGMAHCAARERRGLGGGVWGSERAPCAPACRLSERRRLTASAPPAAVPPPGGGHQDAAVAVDAQPGAELDLQRRAGEGGGLR